MARKNHRLDEETSYWMSYSDMMAGLLLAFVLIIAFTVLHAQLQYDEKQDQLLGKEEELLVKAEELEGERIRVADQQIELNAQEEKLTKQGEKISLQEKKLKEQNELLAQLQQLMDEQQAKLDDIIGVRSELVEALKSEFEDSDLSIAVDEQTGAITFDSSILFDYNKDVLTEQGKEFLARFLPRYVSILLGDKYRGYISEILIEGHTDTDGKYMFNLDLSQKRAYSVAEYCLEDGNEILDDTQLDALRSVVSVTGRSYSKPVYAEDGSVDMEASRRVEFLFRLKDEEMVREMIDILSSQAGDEQAMEDGQETEPGQAEPDGQETEPGEAGSDEQEPEGEEAAQ